MHEDLLLRHKKRANLLNAIVRRRGLSAKQWYFKTDKAITIRGDSGADRDALAIHFSIPAGGQGDTFVEVAIKPKDFPILISIMSATDRDATLRAMAEELRYQLCGKPK
jgi:hypothetical protein